MAYRGEDGQFYADKKTYGAYQLMEKIQQISAAIPDEGELVQVEGLNGKAFAIAFYAGRIFWDHRNPRNVKTYIPERSIEIARQLVTKIKTKS